MVWNEQLRSAANLNNGIFSKIVSETKAKLILQNSKTFHQKFTNEMCELISDLIKSINAPLKYLGVLN